jgi:hypothetical protein
MCDVIKTALTLVFDAQYPDASTSRQIAEAVAHPDRNNYFRSGPHACFSIAGYDTNVCWRAGSRYDVYLWHFFRVALFHALAYFKYFMPYQKYIVSENLELEEHRSGRHSYRKVILAFSIDENVNAPDSSDQDRDPDYDAKGDQEIEEDQQATVLPNAADENTEAENEEPIAEEEDSTLVVSLRADGSSTLHQPQHYRQITQIVEFGRDATESEQLGALVHHLIPLLDLSQLEVLAARATSHINVLRERAAEQALTDEWARNRGIRRKRKQTAVRANCSSSASRFRFNTTSFSSSEGDEGDEDEEEGE